MTKETAGQGERKLHLASNEGHTSLTVDWKDEAGQPVPVVSKVERRLKGIPLQSLAREREGDRFLAAGTVGEGLFFSEDGGSSWKETDSEPGSGKVFSLALRSAGNGSERPTLFAGTEPSAFYRSDDGGSSWHEFPALTKLPSKPEWRFPPRPHTSHVRAIAIAPDDPDLIYVGIELGGVMRSRDGGSTWDDRLPGAYHDCHALAVHPAAPNRLYLASGTGPALSRDRRETLPAADEGLDRRYCWALAVDSVDPDLWYVSATSSARSAHYEQNARAAIFRRREPGNWEKLSQGLPQPVSPMIRALAADPLDRGGIFAALRDGTLFWSGSAGRRWHRIDATAGDLSEVRALAIGSGGNRP